MLKGKNDFVHHWRQFKNGSTFIKEVIFNGQTNILDVIFSLYPGLVLCQFSPF
jgi:hypothetical protein